MTALTVNDKALMPHFSYKGYGPIRIFDYASDSDVEVYRDEALVATITVRTTHTVTDVFDWIDGIDTGHTTAVVWA